MKRKKRSSDKNMFFRWLPIELHRDQPKDENCVRVIASTDSTVDFGGFREILMHTPEAVDMRAAATCLYNHNRNMPIGGIRSCSVDGKQMIAELEISPDARAESGIKILEAVRKGHIRGVSIGYQYDMQRDADVRTDEAGITTVTARKWQLREISITPTQADIASQVVRSLPDAIKQAAKPAERNIMNEAEKLKFRSAARAAGMTDAEIDTILARAEMTYSRALEALAEGLNQRGTQTEAARELEAKRTAQIAVDKKIIELARTHGVEKPEELLGMTFERASTEILRMVTEKKTKAGEGATRGSAALTIEVGAEAQEKTRDAAVNAILARAGLPIDEKQLQGNQFAGKRAVEIARRYAVANGERGAQDWQEHEIGNYALGKSTAQRSANVSSSNFASFVVLNAMDKAVSLGFKAFGQNATYPKWTRTRNVADFKQVTGAALDVGNLVKTVEDAPFPELLKAEFGYNATLAMWGVTASFTLQALINDDLGEFINQIFRSGQIANRTIEKECATQLEAATWTSNTSSGAGLGSGAAPTPGNLDVARSAFVKKTGPGGEIIGSIPKWLMHQPTQGVPVGIALGRILFTAGAASGSVASLAMEPIENPFLTGTATTYYLLADPAVSDTVIVLKLSGMDTPQIEEYDSGAVAARKWKIYLPFTVKPVTNLVTLAAGGTAQITPGMQQATV